MMLTIWLLVLGAPSSSFATKFPVVIHERRDVPLHNAIDRRRVDADVVLPMRIGLRQSQDALSEAESWLMAVSDPDSDKYGRHWTQQEVIEAFRPSDHTVNVVRDWLLSHGITKVTHSDNKQWFAFDATAAKAEALLQTKYYEHQRNDGGFEASCDYYYLPEHVGWHIDYITPAVKGSDVTGRTKRSRPLLRSCQKSRAPRSGLEVTAPNHPRDSNDLSYCWHTITPACIRALYNIPLADPSVAIDPSNSLGIFAADDIYTQHELDRFFAQFTNIPSGTAPKFVSIDGAVGPAEAKHNYTLLGPGENILDILVAMPLIYPQNATVYKADSKSSAHHYLDFFPQFLDAIDGSFCKYKEVNDTGGKLQCGVYKPPNVMSLSYGQLEPYFPEAWRKRQCQEYLKLGLQGVSLFFSTGDSGAGGFDEDFQYTQQVCKDPWGERILVGQFPATCPWVTAVGATQIGYGRTVYDQEIAANWWYDQSYYIGSGTGGFSFYFDVPTYQSDAVAGYFDTANPPWPYFRNGHYRNSTGRYNRNGRGVPDISANGNWVAIYSGNYLARATGTSAAAPMVAGIFNRIVEERLRAGKGRVGFVNPTLYKHPEAFNDIISGSNGMCSPQAGFESAAGWDPVTGIGTPDYRKLLELYLNLP